ncbi:gas vesicle protein [Streptomyces sp. NPDC006339]|uniref:gas vesicle protein GvpO n=1 Tax=Streptomyces sp. NPDC006339 TaxID=3156755 RepID=UPI0033B09702
MAQSSNSRSQGKAADAEPRRPPPVAEVSRTAREQLSELLNQPAETVSACARNEDGGWRLTVEVLELRRVPDTMSLLASYEVDVDPDGYLVGHRRTHRYERGRADRR